MDREGVYKWPRSERGHLIFAISAVLIAAMPIDRVQSANLLPQDGGRETGTASQLTPAHNNDKLVSGGPAQDGEQKAGGYLDKLLQELIKLETTEDVGDDDCDRWSVVNDEYTLLTRGHHQVRQSELDMKERCQEMTLHSETQYRLNAFNAELAKETDQEEFVANLISHYVEMQHAIKRNEHLAHEYERSLAKDANFSNSVKILKSFIDFVVGRVTTLEEYQTKQPAPPTEISTRDSDDDSTALGRLERSIKQLVNRESVLKKSELKQLVGLSKDLEATLSEERDQLDVNSGRFRYLMGILDAAHTVILNRNKRARANKDDSARLLRHAEHSTDQDNDGRPLDIEPNHNEDLDNLESKSPDEIAAHVRDFAENLTRSLKKAGATNEQDKSRNELSNVQPVEEPVNEVEQSTTPPLPLSQQQQQPQQQPQPLPQPAFEPKPEPESDSNFEFDQEPEVEPKPEPEPEPEPQLTRKQQHKLRLPPQQVPPNLQLPPPQQPPYPQQWPRQEPGPQIVPQEPDVLYEDAAPRPTQRGRSRRYDPEENYQQQPYQQQVQPEWTDAAPYPATTRLVRGEISQRPVARVSGGRRKKFLSRPRNEV